MKTCNLKGDGGGGYRVLAPVTDSRRGRWRFVARVSLVDQVVTLWHDGARLGVVDPHEDDVRPAGVLDGVPQSALAMHGVTLVYTPTSCYRLVVGHGGEVTATRVEAEPPVPTFTLRHMSQGTFSIPGVTIAGNYAGHLQLTTATDTAALAAAMTAGYTAAAEANALAGLFTAPVVARVRYRDSAGAVLHLGMPVLLAPKDAARTITAQLWLEETLRRTEATDISAPPFECTMRFTAAQVAVLKEMGVATVDVLLSPQLLPCDPAAAAPWRVDHPQGGTAIFAAMPGSGAAVRGRIARWFHALGAGDSRLEPRATTFIDLEAVEGDGAQGVHATVVPRTDTRVTWPLCNALEPVDPATVRRQPLQLCECRPALVHDCGAGALLAGVSRALPAPQLPVVMQQGDSGAGLQHARLTVSSRDGRHCVAASATLQEVPPLVAYPHPGGATLTVETAGTAATGTTAAGDTAAAGETAATAVVARRLALTPCGAWSVYIAPALEAQPLDTTAVAVVPVGQGRVVDDPGGVWVASKDATAPLVERTEGPWERVAAIEEAPRGSSSAYDRSRRQYLLLTDGGTWLLNVGNAGSTGNSGQAGSAGSVGRLAAPVRLDGRAVTSASRVCRGRLGGEEALVALAGPCSDLTRIYSTRVTTLQGGTGCSMLLWDPLEESLLLLDGSPWAQVWDKTPAAGDKRLMAAGDKRFTTPADAPRYTLCSGGVWRTLPPAAGVCCHGGQALLYGTDGNTYDLAAARPGVDGIRCTMQCDVTPAHSHPWRDTVAVRELLLDVHDPNMAATLSLEGAASRDAAHVMLSQLSLRGRHTAPTTHRFIVPRRHSLRATLEGFFSHDAVLRPLAVMETETGNWGLGIGNRKPGIGNRGLGIGNLKPENGKS